MTVDGPRRRGPGAADQPRRRCRGWRSRCRSPSDPFTYTWTADRVAGVGPARHVLAGRRRRRRDPALLTVIRNPIFLADSAAGRAAGAVGPSGPTRPPAVGGGDVVPRSRRRDAVDHCPPRARCRSCCAGAGCGRPPSPCCYRRICRAEANVRSCRLAGRGRARTWQPSLLGAVDEPGVRPHASTAPAAASSALAPGSTSCPAGCSGADTLFERSWRPGRGNPRPADVRPGGHRAPAHHGRWAARRRRAAWPRRSPTATASTSSAVSANLYRDGADSVAWHGDTLGRHRDETVVAIVSLGEPRRFLLRPKGGGGPSIRLTPGHGDLLVMGGTCQHTWDHCVPKCAAPARGSPDVPRARRVLRPDLRWRRRVARNAARSAARSYRYRAAAMGGLIDMV